MEIGTTSSLLIELPYNSSMKYKLFGADSPNKSTKFIAYAKLEDLAAKIKQYLDQHPGGKVEVIEADVNVVELNSWPTPMVLQAVAA